MWPPLYRAQCLADLYDGFTISSGKHVKGRQTLGENIADCGGVKDSFRALQSYLRDKKNTQRTEQEGSVEEIFGFTHDQLFFVSYGQAWCGLVTPQRADYLLNNDVHSPAKVRRTRRAAAIILADLVDGACICAGASQPPTLAVRRVRQGLLVSRRCADESSKPLLGLVSAVGLTARVLHTPFHTYIHTFLQPISLKHRTNPFQSIQD